MPSPEASELDPLVEFALLEEQLKTLELAKTLRNFIPFVWPIVEPNPYVSNWHIDALDEHLTAVTNGDITDLLVTMPPRHSKSLIIAVIWPVWEWLQKPQHRFIFASYSFSLSVRDSLKRRNLIQHKLYQERWGDMSGAPRFSLIKEQNTKVRFENDKRGFMLASSVGGSNTGEGGERIVVDDPHNIKDMESEDVRKSTVDWWNVVMSTRRNVTSTTGPMQQSARIVVQQRTHEGDVAGDIIERGGYVHLNLPAELGFAGVKRCFTQWVEKKAGRVHAWTDPRKHEGELMNPLRFDRGAIERAKLDLGDYQYAAQFGQNPTPPDGSIIKKDDLRYYGGSTGIPVPDWTRSTHSLMPLFTLDCTFKEHKDTDYVAGLAWAMFGADIYLLPARIHERLSFTKTLDAVAEFCGGQSLDGAKNHPGIYPFLKFKLVEDKANGSAIIDTLRHRIPGMVAFSPDGASKESRLQACSWRFRAGNVWLPHESIAPWIKEYVYELCAFPKAKKDDYVDATSMCLLFIGGSPQVQGTAVMEGQKSRWFGEAAEATVENPLARSGDGSRWTAFTGITLARSKSIWKL